MNTFNEILGSVHGGKVLDVATGVGGFVRTLKESLASYDEIIGVDNSERSAQEFPKAFDDPCITFQPMDAMRLEFPDASFDTASISFSLHHLADPGAVLREMLRVLRPGGHLIVAEMYCDGQSETQISHVLLHHWWAAVDRKRGVSHNETYRRDEILELTKALDLGEQSIFDLRDLSDDPHDPETIKHLEGTIDQYLQHLAQLGGPDDLARQGEALRGRLRQLGAHGADTLVLVGTKKS